MPSRIRVFIVAAFAALTITSSAAAGPMPKDWHAPRPWLYQAWCLHDGMKRDDLGTVLYRVRTPGGRLLSGEGAWNAATGNGYEGGLQFLRSTWVRAGGAVDKYGHWASVVSPREQLYRAWIIWRSHHGSWSEWGEMRPACGLR